MDIESDQVSSSEYDEGRPSNNQSEESEKELHKLEEFQKEKENFVHDLKKKTKPIQKSEDKDKEDNLTSRMKFLLNQADIFAHFLLSKNEKHKTPRKSVTGIQKKRVYINENDDDEDLLNAENNALEHVEDLPTRLTVQPSILKGGTLKEFQVIGLNWLISLYENGINGILADEMGLGKTIQTIALIGYLKQFKKIHGPHMVIAPKSTLGNWHKEFKKWLPCCRVIKLVATKDERTEILKNQLKLDKFDVVLTSYQGVNLSLSYLNKFKWKYVIIDEAHKIKNEESLLSLNVRQLHTNYKVLLTGTPLQNNLHELWSLLNYLLPDIFESSEVFDSWFDTSSERKKNETDEELENKQLETIKQLHKIIKPFMLRRTKAEVDKTIPPKKELHLFIGLTELQTKIYKNLLRNRNALENDSKNHYLNILMQLRKVCNHPYLFEGVEEQNTVIDDDQLYKTSGKMIILDKLLFKLKPEKHQVLIFSQMTKMLDILEDYCITKQYSYCRIDGDTDIDERDRQIGEFTEENSSKFIFLLSTRAGGLGINLMTADTVILYDSDWNPQMDLQAIDRAHRIGQVNPVNVYRLICEDTVEEKIIERQRVKLSWDNLVIQQGRLTQKNKAFTKEQLKEMIQFGANKIFRTNGGTYTDEDIESLLLRGEEKAKIQQEEIDKTMNKNKNFLDLAFTSVDLYEFQNENYALKKKEDEIALREALLMENKDFLVRTRREKKTINSTMDFSVLEKEALNNAKLLIDKKPKLIKVPDHHLFLQRERLIELLTKESEYKAKPKPKLSHNETNPEENIMNNGLKIEENQEKERLLKSGLTNWTKVEFNLFVQACERFGRNDLEKIAEHVGKTKTLDDIKKYSEKFWERVADIQEGPRIVKLIERGEKNLIERANNIQLIKDKCSYYKNPRDEIEFNTNYYSKFKDRFFTFLHDRFLIYSSFIHGYENADKIKNSIKEDNCFKFDHFFRSRNEQDLLKRTKKLIKVLEREKDEKAEKENKLIESAKKQKTNDITVTETNIKKESTVIVLKSNEKKNTVAPRKSPISNSNIQNSTQKGNNNNNKISMKQTSLEGFVKTTNNNINNNNKRKNNVIDLEGNDNKLIKKQKIEEEGKPVVKSEPVIICD